MLSSLLAFNLLLFLMIGVAVVMGVFIGVGTERDWFLKDARVREADGGEYDVAGPWILLTEASKVKLIEFLE